MSLLTTLYLYKQFAEIADATSDKKLTRIIAACSIAIESWLNRTIGETTHKIWLDGKGNTHLLLPNWPVSSIYMVGIGTTDVLKITNTTAVQATVEVNDTSVLLFSVSTAGVATQAELTKTLYPTVTLMAAAINGQSGWSATISSGKDTQPMAAVRPFASAPVVSPDTIDLEVFDDAVPARMSDDYERCIQRTWDRVFISDDVAVASSQTLPIFPMGYGNIFVWYKAGYTLPVDNAQHSALDTVGNLPDDIITACNHIVKAVYDASTQEMGADSMSVSALSFSIGEGGRGMLQKALEDVKDLLMPYRRCL